MAVGTDGTATWTLDYSNESSLSSSTDWGSYGKAYNYTASDDGIWTVKAYKNAGMQLNTGKDCSIKIPSCSGNIQSISITCSQAKAVGFSASDYSGSGTITYLASGSDAKSQTLDLSGASVTNGYIVPKGGSTSITKIVVTYISSTASHFCTTVEDYPVTIGSAGYTTYVTGDKVTMPTGVTAYIATKVNTNTIHIEEVENVPANEPIILKASAGTYYLPVITSSTDDVSANILQASTGSTTGNGSSIYALGVGKTGDNEGVVGFYLVKSGVSVPAGKAYLTIGGGSSVKDFLGFSFGDETKITETSESIHNSECIMLNEAGAVFDLSGRRVSKAQKGLYILNGRKVLVK